MNRKEIDGYRLALAALAIVFVLIYSWHFYASAASASQGKSIFPIFSWPDAMANNFFVQNFIDKSDFVLPEPLNVPLGNIIHPRSTNVSFNGDIVPTAFLGFLIVYGWLGKIIGTYGVYFLTPLFAALGTLFFYGLIKNVFNKRIGFLSALLLFTLASYWYYANLVMLGTVFFVFLVIAGLFFLVKSGDGNKYAALNSALSGFFLGFAIITRVTEAPWLMLVAFLIFLFNREKVSGAKVLLFSFCFLMPIGIMLYYNRQTYGNALMVGYLQFNQVGLFEQLPTEMQVGSKAGIIARYLKLVLIPFGFSPKTIALNFYNYFIKFLWPYVVLFAAGGLTWLWSAGRKKVDKAQIVFALAGGLTCVWLVFYYGSWQLADSLILKNNLIGSSYIRYWLPMNIIILPFIAWLFDLILEARIMKVLSIILVGVWSLGLAAWSFNMVCLSKGDGLIAQNKIIGGYYELADKVQRIIPPETILITDRADKLFFPKYKVTIFNLDYSIFTYLKKVVGQKPVYYLSYRTDKDMEFINDKKIKALGLRFTDAKVVDGEYRLYKLEPAY